MYTLLTRSHLYIVLGIILYTSVVSANMPPTVLLTGPASRTVYRTFNSGLHLPDDCGLTVVACDPDGSIASVVIRKYEESWYDVPPHQADIVVPGSGHYAFGSPILGGMNKLTKWVAIVTDDKGATTVSNPIIVELEDPLSQFYTHYNNHPPRVELVSPPSGTLVKPGTCVTLAFNASDPDGDLFTVTTSAPGTLVNQNNGDPNAFTSTWRIDHSGTMSVRVVDSTSGLDVYSSVDIHVIGPPEIEISISSTEDGNGTHYFISADATDYDGSIEKVEYCVDGHVVGACHNRPFTLNIDNLPPGDHTLTAIATDNDGNKATSKPIVFNTKDHTWSHEPTHGDPVGLVNGEESHHADPDLVVMNEQGPGVMFSRNYSNSSLLTKHLSYWSPGLTSGWTHSYDVYVKPENWSAWSELDSTLAAWPPLNIHYPDGSLETLTPEMSANSALPTGKLIPSLGSALIANGTLDQANGRWESIVLTMKDQSKYTFTWHQSGVYALTRISDRMDHYISLVWDNSRRLQSVCSDDGNTLLTCSYDNIYHLLSEIHDDHGRQIVYEYTVPPPFPGLFLSSVSQIVATGTVNPPINSSYTYIGAPYYAALESVSRPSPTGTGRSTISFTYGADGKVQTQTDENGNISSYSYENLQTVVTVTDANGNVIKTWTQHFDEQGRDTGVTDADGQRTWMKYEDPYNPYKPTEITAKDGKVITYTYDPFGSVTGTSHP